MNCIWLKKTHYLTRVLENESHKFSCSELQSPGNDGNLSTINFPILQLVSRTMLAALTQFPAAAVRTQPVEALSAPLLEALAARLRARTPQRPFGERGSIPHQRAILNVAGARLFRVLGVEKMSARFLAALTLAKLKANATRDYFLENEVLINLL